MFGLRSSEINERYERYLAATSNRLSVVKALEESIVRKFEKGKYLCVFAHVGVPMLNSNRNVMNALPLTSMLDSSLTLVPYLIGICAYSKLLYHLVSGLGYVNIDTWARSDVLIHKR